jgi:DNA mismatch repair ATPase MutS
LLQAEARRCKQIIDAVKETPTTESHLCVFDEIYSGTNPEEAVQSAFAVMKYLANKPNVSIMLTTHYVELCQKMKDHPNMVNNRMKVTLLNDLKDTTGKGASKFVQDFKYTYLLEKGISKVKGGVKVLIDMKYPEEILSDM